MGLRILVIEDESIVAMLMEDMLTDFGCVVVDVAGTVQDGLRIIEAKAEDLDGAVLDVNLGGEKVFPIADALKAHSVKFLFTTGYGAAGLESRYAQAAVLAKPFDARSLQRLLMETLL